MTWCGFRQRAVLLLVLISAAGAGCTTQTYLVATPHLARHPHAPDAYAHLPAQERRTEMEVLYAVDRASLESSRNGPRYGFGRGGKLIIGSATVDIYPSLTWDELVSESTTYRRSGRWRLVVESATELGMLTVSLDRMEVRDGRYVLSADATRDLRLSQKRLDETLRQRLIESDRKDVYIFVHGFNNSFEDSLFRVAQLWHFMGRPGVPVAYSWPAGYGGLFGYAYDRESGEYTVFHLKRFLVAMAQSPHVERIHLIAHSRGADVAVTALRELNIHYKARGLSTREQLKLENLVLAAPDLDADVFEQRFAIEDLHLVAGRTTVYLSQSDLALTFSNWLFGGRRRLGNLSPKEFTTDARQKMSKLNKFSLIECQVRGYSTSHDYVFAHPAVLSDVVLLLRDNRDPGAGNGRPLITPYDGIWRITNDYLAPQDRK